MPKTLPTDVKMSNFRDKMSSASKCASFCRAKKNYSSCALCTEEPSCDTQKRYNNALTKLKELEGNND